MVKIPRSYEPRPCRRTQLESKKSDAAQLPLFNEAESTAVEAVLPDDIPGEVAWVCIASVAINVPVRSSESSNVYIADISLAFSSTAGWAVTCVVPSTTVDTLLGHPFF